MQINSVVNYQIVPKEQNFKGGSADNAVQSDSQKISESDKKESNAALKLLHYPSLIIVPTFPFICYEIYNEFKEDSISKKIKNSLIKEDKLNAHRKVSQKVSLALCAAAIPLYFLTDYINKKNEDKNFDKAVEQVEEFNEQNQTNIKLIKTPVTTKNIHIAGGFIPLSAQIHLPEKMPGDLIFANLKQKYTIKHELIHAKQYMLMARSNDGINKLNFIVVKRMARKLNEDKKLKIYNTYQEIIKTPNNQNDETVSINGCKINTVDFITALYKVLYDEKANPDNIPIIINKDFYSNAAKKSLTEAEEKKAQAYFDAFEKYPPKTDFIQSLNPYSDYHQNLLEQEASKATPWYINLVIQFLYFF